MMLLVKTHNIVKINNKKNIDRNDDSLLKKKNKKKLQET